MESDERTKSFGQSINIGSLILMVVLFCLLIFDPFIPEAWTAVIFLASITVSAWLVSEVGSKRRIAGAALGITGILIFAVEMLDLASLSGFIRQPLGFILAVMTILLLFYCGGIILGSLMRTSRVTPNEILGTINLYLILGFIWAHTYGIVELYRPGSFKSSVIVEDHGSELVYFSFVTLTTLGYGDITPITSIARMLSIVEAIVGQFYVAVVITYLLSVYITQQHGPGNK
jgi:voltage-gated potassium channel